MRLKVKNDELKNITIDELLIDEKLFTQHKNSGLFIDDGYRLNPAIVSLKVKPE